jgi:hypothetical protein
LTRDNDVEMCILEPDLCPHDFEQLSSLFVRIRVDDSGTPVGSAKFWVEVTLLDENDPPVHMSLDENTIMENSPIGSLIGSFAVHDQDLYQTATYELISEDPITASGTLFYIEDNNLRLARLPDFEQDQFVLIRMRATDNGTIPRNVSVNIRHVEQSPTRLF